MADPVAKAVYQEAAARKGEPVFALTVGDFLNEPAVDEIDLSDQSAMTNQQPRIVKKKRNKCPLTPPGSAEPCPLKTGQGSARGGGQTVVTVSRTERRSWITIAITAFGALVLRYLKTVRERGRKQTRMKDEG
jgi:hypothetical protein